MNLKDFSTLQIALGLSVIAHVAVLTVRFVDPEGFNRIVQDTPLEIILVNAKAPGAAPDKPKLLAQTQLAGGGDLDKGRATSPLPPSAFTAVGDSAEEAQKQIEALHAQQMLMLAQIKQQLAAMPAPDPRNAGQPNQDSAQEEKRRQLLELLAEIERRVNEENARPKKRYVSPATKEVAYAIYADTLRRKLEVRGTERFPEANGKKLYGSLMMTVGVNFDGRVISTQIDRSSGNRDLDRRAQAIVMSLGQLESFTPAMRRQVDQLFMVMTFTFARDNTLQAEVGEAPPGAPPATP